MENSPRIHEAVLEVFCPGCAPEVAAVMHTPFLIGRGGDTGNHLLLEDPRISRRCAAIVEAGDGYRLEDRGHRHGIWVNGQKVAQRMLAHGDTIEFGLEDSPRIVFRLREGQHAVENMLTRIGKLPQDDTLAPAAGLGKLNLLLEATSLLHSALPLDSVLGSMLDHAISITGADRALLLEAGEDGGLKVKLARGSGGSALSIESISPSQTAVRQAVAQRSAVITDDLNLAGASLQSAQSVVVQGLRAVVAIPLFPVPHAIAEASVMLAPGKLLGVVYLDSRRPAAFSNLDRQILDALGAQAASILDNARLVEREREQRRMEQELAIAREIQQGLLPHGLRDFPYLAVSGMQYPCHAVGGDYYDVFPLSDDRTAFLIADVAGKGLGAALLTTMLQGALTGMRLGVEPGKVFNHINRFMCEHADIGRYATMFFATVDRSGTLEFLRGGHPSPLLIRDGRISDIYIEGSFPVGLIEEATYDVTRLQLQPEDTIVLFTDGIVEAANTQKELFGFERLRDTIAPHVRSSIEVMQKAVLDAVESFSCGAGQADDITLLIVRYRTPAN
jgi:sigma-B regulation protein RsbU (phosphoserine phosphatase)